MSGVAEFTAEFFDQSSAAWRANKRHVGDGMFKYVRPRKVVPQKVVPQKVVPQKVLPQKKKVKACPKQVVLPRRSPRLVKV